MSTVKITDRIQSFQKLTDRIWKNNFWKEDNRQNLEE